MHVGYVRSCMGNMSQRGISVYNAGKSLHVRECRLQAYRPPSGSHALTFSQFAPLIAGKLSLMWASFHLAIKQRLSPHCSRQEAQLSQSNRTCQLKPCHNQMIAFEKARNRSLKSIGNVLWSAAIVTVTISEILPHREFGVIEKREVRS